ncbi:MAG: hypothetical protein ABI696_14045 [Rubrivivax sp.]
MQISLHTNSSVDAYIAADEWRNATLSVCPLHPEGSCGLARHGSYARVRPQGLRVARWYCPQGHRTFSLLPDFMAARLPGLLAEVEEVVAAVARTSSIEAAAATVRELELSLRAAVRWLRRRLRPVQFALRALGHCADNGMVGIGAPGFLVHLRRELEAHTLARLPPPLGWQAGRLPSHPAGDSQHEMGPDAPARTIYRGRHTSSAPVWPPTHRRPNDLGARPPPRTSFAYGGPTEVSGPPAHRATCNGSTGFAATAANSVLMKPTN